MDPTHKLLNIAENVYLREFLLVVLPWISKWMANLISDRFLTSISIIKYEQCKEKNHNQQHCKSEWFDIFELLKSIGFRWNSILHPFYNYDKGANQTAIPFCNYNEEEDEKEHTKVIFLQNHTTTHSSSTDSQTTSQSSSMQLLIWVLLIKHQKLIFTTIH